MNGSLCLLPPLLTIFSAVLTRRIYFSLTMGLFCGAIIVSNTVFIGLLHGVDAIITVCTSENSKKNILFILMIGALIKVMEKSGGVNGFIYLVTKRTSLVTSNKGAQILTYCSGFFMFMEGVGSMMIVGVVGRSMFDKFGISREKLAYTANCTGSPIAWLFPLSGAGVFLMSIISEQIDAGVLDGSSLTYLINAIPYQFYSLLLLISVPSFILLDIEFGKMRSTHKRIKNNSSIVTCQNTQTNPGKLGAKREGELIYMLFPLTLLMSSILSIIFITGNGDFTNGDPGSAIYISIFLTLLATGIYYQLQGVSKLKIYMKWCIEGGKSMIPAVTVLILALALSSITNQLGTGAFLAKIVIGSLPTWLIPASFFVTSCLISFSTGSSGASVGIIAPLIISLSVTTNCDLSLALGAMVSGAVFGDQCSPISDSVIVASTAAGCRSIDHFSSQISYCISIAFCAMILFMIAGRFQ